MLHLKAIGYVTKNPMPSMGNSLLKLLARIVAKTEIESCPAEIESKALFMRTPHTSDKCFAGIEPELTWKPSPEGPVLTVHKLSEEKSNQSSLPSVMPTSYNNEQHGKIS